MRHVFFEDIWVWQGYCGRAYETMYLESGSNHLLSKRNHFYSSLAAALLLQFFGSNADAADSVTAPEPVTVQVPGTGSSLLDVMASRAQTLAQQAYQPPARDLPDVLRDMNYDRYRSINFRPEAALWRGIARFEVQLFHPGFIYQEPVTLRSVTLDGGNTPLAFNPDLFVYHGEKINLPADVLQRVGYAGLRVHYPINTDRYKDEFLVFQGASYFRLVGPGQIYGLSARGLAIDTAAASGEEFPTFREFWLVQPEPEATQMQIFALLDSPSITGAYQFDIAPGTAAATSVEARLFARKDIGKIGIAPLTSMFFFGENRTQFFDDFRPEVHDSDGVLMLTRAGEWIWRPLTNPPHLRVTSLQDESPRGFGLVQRDRSFASYQDAEARYDRRPSLWVEPEGDWGKGRLEVVEIPTDAETNDNIVTYWVPAEPVKANQALTFRYRLHTFDERLPLQNLAQVVATRIGWAALPGQKDPPPRSKRQFIVDFRGGPLDGLPSELPLVPELSLNGGTATDVIVSRLPGTSTWRVFFKLSPESEAPVDMRLFLSLRDQRLSEVWNYVWSPEAVRP
jgi:glucans biosynthesis protein